MHSTSSAAAARGLLLLLVVVVVGRLVERVLHGALEALLELGAELDGGDVDGSPADLETADASDIANLYSYCVETVLDSMQNCSSSQRDR